MISSQGDNYFWHCEAWVAPEIDLAVLVVTNQGGPGSGDAASVASAKAVGELVKEFAR